MTARLTSRAGAKAGHSDPAVKRGIAVAQRIKGTPGITGLSFPRVHIDGRVWHLNNIWGGPAEMPVMNRLITVEPTPVRPSDAVSWVIPWEVCRKCRPSSYKHSASDPVTTEAARPRWCSCSTGANLWTPQHADPSPLVRQGGDIVCAAGNGGTSRDVGSSHPGAGAGPKGRAVRPLKRYASWVQNVVRQ